MKDREREAEEARRTLAALSRESGGLFGPLRMRGGDEPPADAVELWAKRIGRALGLIFVALLAINLFTGWFF